MAGKRGAWVGFDLDGTLAVYDVWRGPNEIGEPIAPMVERLVAAAAEGFEVRIVTARAAVTDPVTLALFYGAYVVWCRLHLGFVPTVTATKDFAMVALYDDRAVAVEMNTGKILGGNDLLAPTET